MLFSQHSKFSYLMSNLIPFFFFLVCCFETRSQSRLASNPLCSQGCLNNPSATSTWVLGWRVCDILYSLSWLCFSREKKNSTARIRARQNENNCCLTGYEMSLFLWTSLLHWVPANDMKLEWSHKCWISKRILTGQFPKTESLLQRALIPQK